MIQCILSELRVVTLNIQQMCLAHVQLLILRDEEFFILAVQPSARSILSQMQPPAHPPVLFLAVLCLISSLF